MLSHHGGGHWPPWRAILTHGVCHRALFTRPRLVEPGQISYAICAPANSNQAHVHKQFLSGAIPWPRRNCLNPLSRPSGRSIRRGAFQARPSAARVAKVSNTPKLNTCTVNSPTNSAEDPKFQGSTFGAWLRSAAHRRFDTWISGGSKLQRRRNLRLP
jgi:hypothetical protein